MSDTISVLVADEDPDILSATARILKSAGYEVLESSTGQGCIEETRKHAPDVILLDAALPDIEGTEVCRRIRADSTLKKRPFILLLSGKRASSAHQTEGLEGGADGYIARPVAGKELLARVGSVVRIKRAEEGLQRAHDELELGIEERTKALETANLELRKEIEERKRAEHDLQEALAEIRQLKERLETENLYLREEIKLEHNYEAIVGSSDALRYVLYKVEQVAPTDTTVLVLGETGTGKELIARAIHERSPRRGRPLVKVNCAALPGNLIESELFGHEKGAFTGAQSRQIGRFELADRGTLFLDEIGDLPLELQAKLLRVLQDGELERVGSSRTIRVDVRVIAATNRNLKEDVKNGRFREDLWYRINVFPITVPPLRQRREDVPLLVVSFVDTFGKKMGKHLDRIAPESLKALQNYAWPGNVRELQNIIERAVIVSRGSVLSVDVPEVQDGVPDAEHVVPDETLTLEDVERQHILRVLEASHWKIEGKNGAARILGLNGSTLRSRMAKLGIKKPSGKG